MALFTLHRLCQRCYPAPLLSIAPASGVIGALLLLSLASLPGALEWWAFLLYMGSPESQACWGWEELGLNVPLPCLVFLGLWAPPLHWGQGVGAGGFHNSGGWRDRVPGLTATAAQLAMATGVTVAGRLESCELPPLLLPGSLGLGDKDCRHHLHCSPGSTSSVCSSPPTFRCADVWNSLASQCVGHTYL